MPRNINTGTVMILFQFSFGVYRLHRTALPCSYAKSTI